MLKKNNQSLTKIIKVIATNSDTEKKLSKFFSEELKIKSRVSLKECGFSSIEQNKSLLFYHRDEKNLLMSKWSLELVRSVLKNITEENNEISELNKRILLYKFVYPVFDIFKDSFQKYISIKELNIKTLTENDEISENETEFCYLSYSIEFNNNQFNLDFLISSKLANEVFSNITLSEIFSKKNNGKKYDFYNIPLKASIVFGKKEMSISDYLKIKTNDTIILNKENQTTVWICFDNGKKIKGILGTSQGKLAIKIIDV